MSPEWKFALYCVSAILGLCLLGVGIGYLGTLVIKSILLRTLGEIPAIGGYCMALNLLWGFLVVFLTSLGINGLVERFIAASPNR
jgi:hypothetical protein